MDTGQELRGGSRYHLYIEYLKIIVNLFGLYERWGWIQIKPTLYIDRKLYRRTTLICYKVINDVRIMWL